MKKRRLSDKCDSGFQTPTFSGMGGIKKTVSPSKKTDAAFCIIIFTAEGKKGDDNLATTFHLCFKLKQMD